MVTKTIGQAGKPAGVVRSMFGRIMAWHNRQANEWTLAPSRSMMAKAYSKWSSGRADKQTIGGCEG